MLRVWGVGPPREDVPTEEGFSKGGVWLCDKQQTGVNSLPPNSQLHIEKNEEEKGKANAVSQFKMEKFQRTLAYIGRQLEGLTAWSRSFEAAVAGAYGWGTFGALGHPLVGPSMGPQYMGDPPPSVGQTATTWRHDPYRSCALSEPTAEYATNVAHVREGFEGDVHVPESSDNSARPVHLNAADDGGTRTETPGETHHSSTTQGTTPALARGRARNGAVVLQSGRKVDRDSFADTNVVPRGDTVGSGRILGASHQNNAEEPIQPQHVHGGDGGRNSTDRGANRSPPARTTDDFVLGTAGHASDEESARIRLLIAQSEARGDHGAPGSSRAGCVDNGGSDAHRQAQADGDDPPVCGGSGDDRSRDRYPKGVKPALASVSELNEDSKFWQEYNRFTQRHTFTRMKRKTRLAGSADMHLPLHAKRGLTSLDVEGIVKLMSDAQQKRFKYVWGLLCDDNGSAKVESQRRLDKSDVDVLMSCQFVEKVGQEIEAQYPTQACVVPFSVVEDKETDGDISQRRRFIAWTRADNSALANYEPKVPLMHVSQYLDKVREDCAVIRDLTCGFFQVSLPPHARAKMRFRSSDGSLYQMTVMPMGHVCAPEIMHALMATLAGDPLFARPGEARMRGCVDVYLDGVRFRHCAQSMQTGLINAHVYSTAHLRMLASALSRSTCGSESHSITRRALWPAGRRSSGDSEDFRRITAAELEAQVSRLIHASAILHIPLPAKYWEIKFVKRRMNLYNRGLLGDDEVVNLPRKISDGLNAWLAEAVANVPVHPSPSLRSGKRSHQLFTDASKQGWGAVLMNDNGEIFVAGGAWKCPDNYEVNAAEARAVANAIDAFQHHWEPHTVVSLFVDNTSVLHAVKKRNAQSEGVSTELRRVLEASRRSKISFDVAYVRSEANPSDLVSRGRLFVRVGG
eukprot:PhM_4_TR2396/c7_g2_i5/m.61156